MRSPDWLKLVGVALVGGLVGCGEPSEPAATVQVDTASAGEEGEIPPDSLLYGAPATEIVRVVPVEVEMPGLPAGWEGLKIAAISDLQLGLWSDNDEVAAAAVSAAAETGADVYFLLGDFVAAPGATAQLEEVLAPLRDKPVLAVLGDRDTLAASLTRTLEGLGAVVLENSSAPVARGGDTAYVAGLSPGFGALPDWRQEEVISAMGGTPQTPILLAHRPGVTAEFPDARYSLVLAGHTFCGEVEVPGTPQLSRLRSETLAGSGLDDTRRLFRVDGNNLLVTCGTGYSFVPVRFGAPPEVLLLTLRGVPAAVDADDDVSGNGAD